MILDRPIPDIAGDPDTSEVTLNECGESLTLLRNEARILVSPAYHARRFTTASDSIWLRRGARDALRRASAALPAGLCLLVWDGLRTLETQREIGDRFVAELSQCGMDSQQQKVVVDMYVSPVPTSEELFRRAPPAHSTGGAVDVGLADDSGRPLDLGAEFDQFDESAWLTHYERICMAEDTTVEDRQRRHRRRMLYWAMRAGGFAPYPWEFWHYEFGTKRAAAFHGVPIASYGPMVSWLSNERAA